MKTQKHIITSLLAVFILSFLNLKAQELPFASQYVQMKYFANPATIGTDDFSTISLSGRQQWIGFKNAPRNQALFGTSIFKYGGIAFGVFNDKNGSIAQRGVQTGYAYHVQFGNKKAISSKAIRLSLGVLVSASQLKIDPSMLTTYEPNDPALVYGFEGVFIPDAQFGAFLHNQRSSLGFAIHHLLKPSYKLHGDYFEQSEYLRHYVFQASQLLGEIKNVAFEPSACFKMNQRNDKQLDINFKSILRTDYWGAISFRKTFNIGYTNATSIIFYLGMKILPNLYFSYGYEWGFGEIGSYTSGSHDFLLQYRLPLMKKATSKSAVPCPAYNSGRVKKDLE